MIRAFVDASVLIAAVLSPTGGSSALLEMAIRRRVDLCVSDDIIEEVLRNVPGLADRFQELLGLIPFAFVSLSVDDVKAVLAFTPAKDAHVVAAARKAAADYLVTFDEKHLLDNVELRRNVEFGILKPGELLQILRTPGG